MPSKDGGLVLEVAPSPTFSPRTSELARERSMRYVGMDFDPGADGRAVDVRASLTDVPFPSDSVDLLICFHVLEHIPDDRAAMREIARVLSSDGIGVLQVPIRRGIPTDEDPEADEPTRVERFGQVDHVRWYGDDFEERLEDAGLSVTAVTMATFFSGFECAAFGLPSDEPMWLVSTGTSLDVEAVRSRAGERTPRVLIAALLDAERRSSEAERRVEEVEARALAIQNERDEVAGVLDRILRRPSLRTRRLLGRVLRGVRRRLRPGT